MTKIQKLGLGVGVLAAGLALTGGLYLSSEEIIDEISIDKVATKFEQATEIKSKYVLNEAQLILPAKDQNSIKIKVGDESSSEFIPNLEISRWNGEVKFKIKPNLVGIDAKDKNLSFEGEKVKFTTPNMEYSLYELPTSTDLEEGGYEYEITLKSKPVTNAVSLDIETQGLDFFYQPSLIDEKHEENVDTCTETDCFDKNGNVIIHRPENIVGSYAIYTSEQKINYVGRKIYKNGKMGQFYRPRICDSNNWCVWGMFNKDLQETKKLTVTMPVDFWDNAVYPIRHVTGTSFGYNTAGGTSGTSGGNGLFGSLFTSPSNIVTATNLIFSVGKLVNDANCKAVIVLHNDSTIISNGVGEAVTVTGAQSWKKSIFSTPPSVSSSVDYVLSMINDDADFGVRFYYDSGSANQGHYQAANSYATPENPIWSHNTNKYSIYATYTVNASSSNFGYYKQITINSAYSSTTQDNYVVLASTTLAELAATSSGGHIQSLDENGKPNDLAFFDNDQTTLLNFEIEKYTSTTGELIAWVKVNDGVSTSSNITFYVYYGYAGGVGYQDINSTWNNSSIIGAWHLTSNTVISSTTIDSASSSNHGTLVGMAASSTASGKIGQALYFDGANDYVQFVNNNGLTSAITTISLWIKPTAYPSTIAEIFGWNNSGSTRPYFALKYGANYKPFAYFGAGNLRYWNYNTNSLKDDNFHNLVLVLTGYTQNDLSNSELYIDGNLISVDTTTVTGAPDAKQNYFNISAWGTYSTNGFIDEVRMYGTSLNINTIKTNYNMENDNATFLTWGAETANGGEETPSLIPTGKFQCVRGNCIFMRGNVIIR